ncbi:MAG: hypothetical protein PHT12_02905 [Patescibacteria group bacterium]|nr:hypothetical protein [Patescibacteria group bacterium]
MNHMWQKLSDILSRKRERRRSFVESVGVAVLTVVAIVTTSLSPVFGWWLGVRRGMVWKGLSVFSPGDLSAYLSFIDQARFGEWLTKNLFTMEPITPSFNVLWWLVGQLARLIGSPLLAFHVARTLLIVLLAVVAWRFIRRFFASSRERLGALALFLFGSGFGTYYAALLPLPTAPSYGSRMEMPVDLWVAESNAFLSMLYSPHFVASLALLLLAFLCLLNAWRRDDWRWAIGGGLSSLVLVSFHPFHAPTLYFVPAVWLAFQAAFRRLRWRQAVAYVIFVAVSLPAFAYRSYLTLFAPNGWQMTSGNLCLSPAPWHYAIGLGAIVILAPFGWRLARRQPGGHSESATRSEWDFLAVWVVVQFLLLYFPFTFQRRLVEGLQFPLTALAVPAIVAALSWCRRRWFTRSGIWVSFSVLATAFALLFLPSSSFAVARNLIAYRDNQPPIFYMSRAEADTLRWVSENAPRDAVFMAKANSGNSLVGWADRRVFVGHWADTIDFGRKARQAEGFFAETFRGRRWRWARELGITHVWCGPNEHANGGECPENEMGFRVIYNKGSYAVFVVEPTFGTQTN